MKISNEIWHELLKILKEFGYNLKKYDHNRENLKFVWEIIINIRENLINDVEQAIRVNLQICYLLEEENQVKTINSILFKIHHIFEQDIYYFENDAEKGLNSFYKTIKSTYGDIDFFICDLNTTKENLYFIRKRYDQKLIRKYKYLKKISIPRGQGYEMLNKEILSIIKNIKLINNYINDPENLNKLLNDIDNIIKKYISIYLKEHNQYQRNLKNFYQELYSLPEYIALEYLVKIDVIKVAYNMRPIKKYINSFFPERCEYKNTSEIIERQVICKCGFIIGQPLTIPSLNKIKPMLKKGISEYIEKLQNKRFKPLFDNYLSYNDKSDLNKILSTDPGKIDNYLKYIDNKLIEEINEALSNTYPLKITLKEIAPQIAGIYPVNQLNILGNDLINTIKDIIKYKMEDMEYINHDDIFINLIL